MIATSPMDPLVLQEAVNILSKRFKQKVLIQSIDQLSNAERRNTILRIHIQNTGKGISDRLIFKQACLDSSETDEEAFARFARDWVGLEFLSHVKSDDLFVPRFYGGSIKHRFILLEDLGEQHISLVDSLTTDNEIQAIAALQQFMKCLGQLHGTGYRKTDRYFDILKSLTPKVPSWQEDLKNTSDDLFPKIKSTFKTFDILQSKGLWDEINKVLKASLEPGFFTTFIHGDNCPDNVFDNSSKNELYLIDFEWGSVRSALLDGTYLRMSMPTCWCAKAIPENLIDSLEEIYRDELKKKIPAAHDDEAYHTAYTNACGFWMLNVLPEVEKVMDKDRLYYSGPVPEKSLWKPEENLGRPRVLSRLQAFMKVAERYDKLPHLRSMAEHVLKALKLGWPDAKPLDVYSAFEGKTHEKQKIRSHEKKDQNIP